MANQLVTRDTLRRQLMLNAARKPLAIGVGLAVAVAALALGAAWLLPVAVVIYVALAASTFFDGNEAERVGQRVYARARTGPDASLRAPRALPEGLTPELVTLLERARAEERRILETIAGSELPFEQISAEVEGLAAEMERIAGRAQSVSVFLEAHDPDELRRRLLDLLAADQSDGAAAEARERAAAAVQDQLRVGEALESELQRFRAEMEHLIASLGVIHGQLVRISVSYDPQLQEDVAREVRDLRTRVSTMADGLRAATDEVKDRA
jgi:hypothetical protein